jgi:dTDP-4-amino-4,6-dideoxygalactose transaminase
VSGQAQEVPFARPSFGGGEAEAVAEVLASGWLTQGPRVEEFERRFAERVDAADAVATTSCTTALHLALYALGVGPGDEVVVPSLSFIATANAVWQCGARPVFADIDPATCNLDPRAAAAAITPRTKAIIPVHQIGLPADMDAFAELAERFGVAIVEDAACAIGARHRGRPIGSLGFPACFSFHPRKVITCGEGGMIATSDPALAERLRRLRQHSMDRSALDRHAARRVVIEGYPEHGFNYRMTDLQAAVGIRQLEDLDFILAERRRLARRYNEAFADVPGVALPYDPPYAWRTWQSYPLRVVPDAPLDARELMDALLEEGIRTRPGVMAIHLEPAYADPGLYLPHTEAVAREVVLLPLFPGLEDAEQDRVIDAVRRLLEAAPAGAGATRSAGP